MLLLLSIIEDIYVTYCIEILYYLWLLLLLLILLSEIRVRRGAVLFHPPHCRHQSLPSQAPRGMISIPAMHDPILTLMMILSVLGRICRFRCMFIMFKFGGYFLLRGSLWGLGMGRAPMMLKFA